MKMFVRDSGLEIHAAILACTVLAMAWCQAEEQESLILREGDRLVLCGDSITAINKYAAQLAYYIEACRPELKIRCYQNALSGESSERFLRRIHPNCIELWRPTVVTIHYHNDSRLDPDIPKAGERYRININKVIDHFEADAKSRVILSSSAILGPGWDKKDETGRGGEDGRRFAHLSGVTREVAARRNLAFAEVEAAMLEALAVLKKKQGADYDIIRGDGGHGDWHGQMAIAIAFLRTMGFRRELARFEIDLVTGAAKISDGHKVIATHADSLTIESRRYPFRFLKSHPSPGLAEMWDVADALGFFDDLNRFTLVVKTPTPGRYEVTWGRKKKVFDSARLEAGINLVHEFPDTPFRNQAGAVFNTISFKFKVQQAIERSLAGPKHRLIPFARMLLAKDHVDAEVETLAGSPEKMNELAEKRVSDALVPVSHSIVIRKAATD